MTSATNIFQQLWKEAVDDIRKESCGTPPEMGEWQRRFPNEYKATRMLISMFSQLALSATLSIQQAETISKMLHEGGEGLSSIQELLNKQPIDAVTLTHLTTLERRQTAKNAANSRHDKPGGSRDKRREILNIWATGKYTSKDICAEQECEALDWSFSSARKALRNAPPLANASKG